MKQYRVIFEDVETGEVDSADFWADGPTDAKNKWKSSLVPEDREHLEWCGCFPTPSRLFSVEDFS